MFPILPCDLRNTAVIALGSRLQFIWDTKMQLREKHRSSLKVAILSQQPWITVYKEAKKKKVYDQSTTKFSQYNMVVP